MDEKNLLLSLSELGLLFGLILFTAIYAVVFPFLFIYSMFIPEGPLEFAAGLVPGLDEYIQ
jgi:hypothetical protein